MSRLLAVSWEMPPMYGPRATQVAATLRELAARGWQPSVVCMDPRRGGPHWRDNADVDLPSGVEMIRVPSAEEWLVWRIASRLAPALRQFPDPERVWVRRAARAADRAARRERFDGLITFAQPWSDHLVGLRLRRRLKLPWVAHFSDPWVDSPYAARGALQRRASARMEREVVSSADAIVFVTDEAADLVMSKYPAAWRRKARVVAHGFDRCASLNPRQTRNAGPLTLVYTGRFYRGLRTPIGLFRALADLNARESLAGTLDVLLMGPHVEAFREDAQRFGLSSVVRFEGRRPRTEASRAAADADVLLVIDAPSAGASAFLPSKLVEYLAFRKPMLGLTPASGASARLLRRLECPVAEPDDDRAIAAAVSDLIRRRREGTLDVSARFDAVRAEYDIRRTTAQLDDILKAVFAGAA